MTEQIPIKVLWLRQQMAKKAKQRKLFRAQKLARDRPLRDPEEVLLEKEQIRIAAEFLEELFADETISGNETRRRLAYTTNGG